MGGFKLCFGLLTELLSTKSFEYKLSM